jgi:hypothetical protein
VSTVPQILKQLVDWKIVRPNVREGNGLTGREITEYFIVRPAAVSEPPINPDDFWGSGYGYGSNAPQNDSSYTDVENGFGGFPNSESVPDFGSCQRESHSATESAAPPEVNLSELADIFRHTLHREPGKNAVFFDDILSCFDGDRVPASAFLQDYGFVLEEIDGQPRVVEAPNSEPAPETPPVSESESSESTSEPTQEQSEATEFRCEGCQHFSGREISPRGLCRKGMVQQDSPDCPKFQLPSK